MSGTRPHRPRGETRRAVAELVARGLSQADIARALGVSRPTVCFQMRKLGHVPAARLGRRYDWDGIRAYYDAGHSARECQHRFGFGRNAWADAVARGAVKPRPRAEPLQDLLVAGREAHRSNLKLRLIAGGLKGQCCETCGLSEWHGKPLALQLHHVNGDRVDNSLANLQLLCPNCHSQTDTWGARNKKLRAALGGEALEEE